MSDFGAQLNRFRAKVEFRTREVFVNTASAVKDSITDGSPLTGAPGQPVDTGNLKSSWQLRFTSPNVAEITTNVIYAPIIEAGSISLKGRSGDAQVSSRGSTQKITFRSAVGGPHSVALTRAGIQNIVDSETKKVNP